MGGETSKYPSKETIERGDRVDIHFSDGESMFDCQVLHIPCAEGDSWRVRNKDGDLIYVQRFEMMSLRKNI